MKVYLIQYYSEISNCVENYRIFGTKKKAEEFCKEANKNFPRSLTHWVEYELE